MDYKFYYFIGIGGIGMSALARYFNSEGKSVYGYDRVSSAITDALIDENIKIHFEDNNIPKEILEVDKNDILVIYTPAIPANHKELNFFIKNNYEIKKRAEVLGLISQEKYTIAVAGTHGKTSTSSLIAHMLTHSGVGCYAFLGGISTNYNTNFIKPQKDSNIMVVEADEFDKSFLHLKPNILIITSTDPDHLDIYKNKDNLINTYMKLISNIKKEGKLIHYNFINLNKINCKSISYGKDGKADFLANKIKVKDGNFCFDIKHKNIDIPYFVSSVAGRHNVLNTLAAIITSIEFTYIEKIKDALKEYKGVKRRMEIILKTQNKIYIDDYAHHPTELSESIKAIKELFPTKKITAIFQPHLFSRTRDFALSFSKSLYKVDKVILLPIYPAREEPIEGISSELILKNIEHNNKMIVQKENLLEVVKNDSNDILVSFGAGDIDRFPDQIKKVLTN